MRKVYHLLTIGCILMCTITTAQRPVRAGTIVKNRVVPEKESKDSVEFYEVEYDTKQKSYMNLLTGNWSFTTMHRQARMAAENLMDIHLTLNADSTYSGTIGCSKIAGKCSVKGTSIRFGAINPSDSNCPLNDQQTWILKLLSETVSNYSVTDTSLLLRDGVSNIVFEATKKQ